MQKKVLLIGMPWGPLVEPSLGMGVLKAILEENHVSCRVLETNLHLLRWLKYSTIRRIADCWAFNDFLFTRDFEKEASPEQLAVLGSMRQNNLGDHYLEELPEFELDKEISLFLRLREEIIPAFLDWAENAVDYSEYGMVGFTCMFDQTIASLALARRIKVKHPNVLIALGGTAVSPPTGPHVQTVFPFVDVVAYGDGEPVIVPLAEAAYGERPLSSVPNISYREKDGKLVFTERVSIDLADSPAPMFDGYFNEIRELKERHGIRVFSPTIPLEGSRGCYWGCKKPCTFCGIKHSDEEYREKPPDIVLQQMDALHESYGATQFRFSDYAIPPSSFKTLIPALADRKGPYKLHCEMRSNLKEKDILDLKRAGFFVVQLGIESFSTPILKSMNKGVDALTNVFSLKALTAAGILTHHNNLFGFPGDTPEMYHEVLYRLPALYHLPPPGSSVRVMIVRFSEMAECPEDFGFPSPSEANDRYEVVFSKEFRDRVGLDMNLMSYYFKNPNRLDLKLGAVFQQVQRVWLRWRRRFHDGARLWYENTEDGVRFHDTRATAKERVYEWGAVHAEIHEPLTHAVCSRSRLLRDHSHLGEAVIQEALDAMCRERVVLQDGDKYVSVAMASEQADPKNLWWRNSEEVQHVLYGHEVHGPSGGQEDCAT